MDYPKVKVCLDTSEDNLIDELYTPCLKWAERFDRGVGYFTTGWLAYNVAGLSDFASRGGKMRLINKPHSFHRGYRCNYRGREPRRKRLPTP